MFVLYGEGLPPATTCFRVGQEVQHDDLSFRISGIDTATNTVTAEVTKAGKKWRNEGVKEGTQIQFHPHSNWEKEGPWWLSQFLPGRLPSMILAAGGEIV